MTDCPGPSRTILVIPRTSWTVPEGPRQSCAVPVRAGVSDVSLSLAVQAKLDLALWSMQWCGAEHPGVPDVSGEFSCAVCLRTAMLSRWRFANLVSWNAHLGPRLQYSTLGCCIGERSCDSGLLGLESVDVGDTRSSSSGQRMRRAKPATSGAQHPNLGVLERRGL
eukprot:1344128-Alexandrium_andersonii.AAC.2